MIDNFGLYFITDSKLSKKGIVEDVKAAIKGGARVVQYRDKELDNTEFKKEAKEIQKICKEKGVLFIINDRVAIAREINADGVHIGMEDMPLQEARGKLPNKIIGVTVHNLVEAVNAEGQGADYLGVSPIFATATKPDAGKPAGIKLIKVVKGRARIPIVAIGGINMQNLRQVVDVGGRNVAMISAIAGSRDVEKAVRAVNDAIRKSKEK